MKKAMTPLAVFVTALMVIVAMVPATIGADSEPTYIIGTSDKATEIGSGITAGIEFNESAFSSGSKTNITILDKNGTSYTFTENKTTVPSDTDNVKINVQLEHKDTGKYTLSFDSMNGNAHKTFVGTKLTVRVTVTETWNNQSISQTYDWGVNIKSDYDTSAKIVLNDGTKDVDNYTFDFETNYKLGISVKINGTDVTNNYTFYATGLPTGLAVTTDGNISGMISKDLAAKSEGTFTVYAVIGNDVVSKTVSYTIGNTDEADFTYTIDGTDNPGYAIISNDGSSKIDVTVVLGDKKNGERHFTAKIASLNKEFDVTWNEASGDFTGSFTVKIPAGTLGEFRVDMTYDYEFSGEKKTVVKSFQVFVVGGIVDADLNPEVNGSP